MPFPLLFLLLICASFTVARPSLITRQARAEDAESLQARGNGGWSFVNYTNDAGEALIPIRNGQGALYHWLKNGTDFSKLKRIVWVCHGKGRDPWNYYNHMHSALDVAVQSHPDVVSEDEVGIWAVSFWNQEDTGAFPWDASKPPGQMATSNILVWQDNGWEDGQESIYPTNLNVSSYEVLDNVVAYFSNRTLFPNVDTIVLASHSMGAQMLQRYAILGNIPDVGPQQELHFYVGNPGAYLYLDEHRPTTGNATAPSTCATYNDYHYGLNQIDTALPYGTPTPNKDLLWTRLQQRRVHYALGMADYGPGDTHCQAKTQGDSHVNRGANFAGYLAQLPGGYPLNQTLDYVPNVTHDDAAMFASSQGVFRLFVENEGLNRTQASNLPNGLTNGLNPTFTPDDPANTNAMPSGNSYQATTVQDPSTPGPAPASQPGSKANSGGGGTKSANANDTTNNTTSGAQSDRKFASSAVVLLGSIAACSILLTR